MPRLHEQRTTPSSSAGPSESVEQSVQFRFAETGTRSIPAALGSFLLRVVPIGASLCIEGELNQTQNHHQVSNNLGLVKRTGESPEFDPILPLCEVGQIQKVLNSTPLGEVISERQLYRHRQRASNRIGDGKTADLLRYCAWMHVVRHTPKPKSDVDPYERMKESARARNAALALAGRDIGE